MIKKIIILYVLAILILVASSFGLTAYGTIVDVYDHDRMQLAQKLIDYSWIMLLSGVLICIIGVCIFHFLGLDKKK